ncbi:protein kinase domain-containing protein [Endozoicomonas elysicola]|nr:serine/threonine-protein kinase [Endozoicomonas elysicola]
MEKMLTYLQAVLPQTSQHVSTAEQVGVVTGLGASLACCYCFGLKREASAALCLTGIVVGRVGGDWVDKKIINYDVKPVTPSTTETLSNLLPNDLDLDFSFINTREQVEKLLQLTPAPASTPVPPGTQGYVSKWLDARGEAYAVKILKPIKENAQWLTPQRGEAVAVGLPEHPNVIAPKHIILRNNIDKKYYSVSNQSDLPAADESSYQVMAIISRWCVGKDLFEQDEKPSLAFAKRVGRDVLKAIEHIHLNKRIHRDIKTENILKTSTGFALTDFGLARYLDEGTNATTPCGTAHQLAPEFHSREAECKYGAGYDLWQFGILMLELATGWTPEHYTDYPEYARTVKETKQSVQNLTDLSDEQKADKARQTIALKNVFEFNSLTNDQRKNYIVTRFGKTLGESPDFQSLILKLLTTEKDRLSLDQVKSDFAKL